MRETARQRAADLLRQMTRREKIGQLNQRLYGFSSYELVGDDIIFSQELREEVEKFGGLGTLYGLFRADPWSARSYENGLYGERAIRAYNELQKYVIEHSRLGIPFLMSSECPHGHQALDGYLLPVNLAAGASFHPELLKAAGEVCGKQLGSMGVNLALVSALDILRDPRWGRSEECFGEDPYLSGCMGRAIVEGIQRQGVAVVAKHFCAQGETTGGINASAASIGERELREIHLPAARACCEAGVSGIMAAYNEIDGVYCHANKWLIEKVLREEFGFSGVVMADGIAIDQLDVMTGDNVKSGALALKSGVDIGLWDKAFSKLDTAVEQGLVAEEDIDRAALRVLELKFAQGLFDAPYIGEDNERTARYPGACKSEVFDYHKYPQSQQLSEESVVMLKNNGVLPIADTFVQIAVIGPNADDIYRQIGDYSPMLKDGSYKTVWEGLKEQCGARRLTYCDGSDVGKARELAGQSELTILVLGGSSSRFSGAVFDANGAAKAAAGDGKDGSVCMDCGEGMDIASLRLPGNQQELFDAVCEAGKQVVTVVVAGRPYAIPEIAEKSDALLYAFYPGPMGGAALAKILWGSISPSGRLPVSLPRSAGTIPAAYNQKSSYRPLHYCDEKEGALYCFGEGMGYSTFACQDINAAREGKGVCLSCIVKNTGSMEDCAVLQCYRRVIGADVVPRSRELKGFTKVRLAAGEERRVTIELDEEFFQVWGAAGAWQDADCELILMDSGQQIFKTIL